ncbi:MAG: polyprenyl synthetase family protein [Wolinella sp.]
MEDFERFLFANAPKFGSFHPYYDDYLWEMVENGGKRLRPRLLLSVVQTCAPLLLQNAYFPALALEILHTYSLIHDDLPAMDNATLRRSCATLHVKYDESSAILAGDALNTHAFYLLANAPLRSDVRIALVSELSSAGGAGGMVLGQALDCHFEDQKLSLEELRFLHIHKTGKLMAAALKMGAIISDLPKITQESLQKIGLTLGLLFQVQDDMIDATWSEEEAGKSTQKDSLKNSYVNLLGLEGARGEFVSLKEEAKALIDDLPVELSSLLLELLEAHFKI